MSRSKSRKMTFNMLNTIINDNAPVEIIVDEEKDLKLTVKRNLDLGDIHGFVSTIVGACFGHNGEYLPEAFEFAVGIATMVFYAGVSAPTNLGIAYRVLTQSNYIDNVIAAIDVVQYHSLIDAARDGVNFMKQAIIQTNAGKINEIAEVMSNMLTESKEATKALNDPEIRQAISSFLSYSNSVEDTNESIQDNAQYNTQEQSAPGSSDDNIIIFRPNGE